MNNKFYKCCAVPMCKSTTIKTPEKLFVFVPRKKQIREQWLTLARRDPTSLNETSNSYYCEDHFDLQNDMENYMNYKMGYGSQIRMRPGCIPTKFECQFNRNNISSNFCVPNPRTKGLRLVTLIDECEKELDKNKTVKKPQHSKILCNDAPSVSSTSSDNLSSYSGHSSHAGPEVEPPVADPNCKVCNTAITGFVFVCVQCDERACGACDAQGHHAQHYVLRAPAGSAEEELKNVVVKVRNAISSSGLELRQQPRAQPPDSKEQTDESDDNSYGKYEIKTEIKLEVDVDEDDPLGSEYEDLNSVPETSGSQVVPEHTEVKIEQPDTSPLSSRKRITSLLPSPSPPSPSPSADSEYSQPLAKRRHLSSDSSSQPVTFQTHTPMNRTEIIKTESATDPNADPGSPSVAGSPHRLKKK